MNPKFHRFFLYGKEVLSVGKEEMPCSFPMHTEIMAAGKWYTIVSVTHMIRNNYTLDHIRYGLIEEQKSNDLQPA